MNHNSRQDGVSSPKDLRELSLAVGEFIRYWGFRRIHGAIWTQLYLSPLPLSGTELAQRLDVSKALVSPALAELEGWGLILPAASPDEKTKLYEAAPDVNTVIRRVLREREAKMIGEVDQLLARLEKASGGVRPDRARELRGMVDAAALMLKLLLRFRDPFALPGILGKRARPKG